MFSCNGDSLEFLFHESFGLFSLHAMAFTLVRSDISSPAILLYCKLAHRCVLRNSAEPAEVITL